MNRRILAFALLVVVTAFMWSDSVIDWWQATLDFFLRVNEGVTESVLKTRPGNDVDLHVLVWAATSLVFAWAFRSKWIHALFSLLMWGAVVETLQPIFTEIRSRQLADYVGNAIGVISAALVIGAITRVRGANQPSSPAR